MDPRLSITSIPLEVKKNDQTIDDFGKGSCRLIAAVFVCSLTWAVGAMQMMTSAFTSAKCDNCTMETLPDEFRLKDDDAYLSEWGTSSFMVGNMIGGIFLTHLADRFGRRPLLLLCLLLQLVSVAAASLAPNMQIFIVCRLFHGAFYTGSTMAGWVAAYEHSATTFRQYTTLIFGMAWVVGYCAVAPIAMVSDSWRHLIAFCGAPILIVFLLVICLVPETLHFLVGKKRTTHVEKWMKKIDAEHLTDVMLLLKIENNSEENEKEQELQLSKENNNKTAHNCCWWNRQFVLYCLIQVYLWTCDNFIYFGLSLYSTKLDGNIYVNYLAMGLIEIPAYIITPYLLDRYGRKRFVSVTHLIAALSFFANMVLKGEILLLISWLVGKLVISCSFMSLFVYASEIFPTEIRNVSVGLCAVLSKLGAMAAPHINHLEAFSPLLPPLVLAVMCGLAALLTLVLPETKNRPLPSFTQTSEKFSP